MSRTVAAGLATVLLGAAAVLAAAPLQQASFRAGTDIVPVWATAIDEGTGQFVTDLTLLDFEIRDNGQIRPVAQFSSERQPFSAVVLLDRSASMNDHADLVLDAARAFIEQLRPGDRVRIGTFADEIVLLPEVFTGDRERLIRVLDDDLPDMGPSPVWEAVDQSMNALVDEPGRRVVLLFSDGHDDPGLGQGLTRLDDLLKRTRVSGVMVYAIGFAAEVTQASRPSIFTRRLPRGGRRWPPGGALPPPSSSVEFTRVRQPPDPGLRELSEASGGAYYAMDADGMRDLTDTFTRIAAELHHQYWLGFVPARLDGRLHDIEVRVRRRDVEVRARRSYLASPPSRR